ncbi:MAG: hypothetical protein ACI9NT_002345 [Bacteroidia bacterium]
MVRVKAPRADYWAVEFGNYLCAAMDYRYRLCSTNCHHAVREEDGELLLVVSHDAPGLPNWLDPSGHNAGYITVHRIGADGCPTPSCEQMLAADLADYLAADVKTMDKDGRRRELAALRLGVMRRFGY